jgi:hypothetical protein
MNPSLDTASVNMDIEVKNISFNSHVTKKERKKENHGADQRQCVIRSTGRHGNRALLITPCNGLSVPSFVS